MIRSLSLAPNRLLAIGCSILIAKATPTTYSYNDDDHVFRIIFRVHCMRNSF